MNIKIKYFLFIATLHIVLTVLVFSLLKDNKIWFIISEVFILLSLALSYSLYRAFIRPIDLMQSGVNALKDNDYNIKFLPSSGSKEINNLIEVFNKLIEQLRQERTKMEAQNYFLQNLINVSPSGIIIFDYDNRITEMNPQALTFCDLTSQWKNQVMHDINNPLLQAIGEIAVGQSKVIAIEGLKKYKCQVSKFIHKGFPRKFVVIEELSHELLSTEKQAYGKVIRMMAHEVNNSIGAINSILETVQEFGFPDPNKDQDLRDSLRVAINRNNHLNQFMHNFADVIRLPLPHRSKVDLNAVMQQTIALLQQRLSAAAMHIEFVASPQPIYISADEIQLEQVFVNIIKNSIEASNAGDTIQITLDPIQRLLQIKDQGSGFSTVVEEQLFSPFFSTKPDGQGIGLIVIREILNNHDMRFSLKNNIGRGATFSIYF